MVFGHVDLPLERIADVCRKYQVRELAIFGSALRDDFRGDSDVDLVVEFTAESNASLFEFCALRNALGDLVGRPVDLVSKGGLKRRVREAITNETRVIYAA